MAYKLVQANAGNYQKGRSGTIKYIVIHYTANKGDTAANNCKYFQTAGRGASANYFVDEKEILQSVKDTDTAWAVGDGKGKYGITNSNSISIELCNFMTYNAKVADMAIPLVVSLMKKYNVGINNVVRHYDASRKICPKPFVDDVKLWNDYKARIKKGAGKVYNKVSEVPSYARPTIQKLIDKKYLEGDTKGNLNLDDDMIRIFVILDRAGMFK